VERQNLEDLDIDGRIIRKWIRPIKEVLCMNCAHLARDWAQWRTAINTVMDLSYVNHLKYAENLKVLVHAMKACKGCGDIAPDILTSAV
jgi:hypothetical protein